MRSILNLEMGAALAYNPLAFVALGLFLLLGMVISRELLGHLYKGPAISIPTWLAWSLGGLVVIFGVVRNIPAWPFTALTPAL